MAKAPEVRITHSARRLNKLASINNARDYLEIGVFNGVTFDQIKVKNRVGVDPNFRFDADKMRNANTHLLEITSDDYFTSFDYYKPQFDLFFIDGLHTFEQTLKDFMASLTLASKDAIWLIDDVIPIDAYSVMTDQMLAINSRREAGLSGGQWHGDVFKIVLFVHYYCPSLSYRTISNKGNPQLVIWREPRENFNTTPMSLTKIENLTYQDFLENKSLFNLTPEDVTLSFVAERMKFLSKGN